MAPFKRTATDATIPHLPDQKKPKTLQSSNGQYKDSTDEIKYGIVLRKFCPPEMVNERALAYNAGKIERPIETLEKAISDTQVQRDSIIPGKCIVHWFKCDTRTLDNRALHLASQMATRHALPLLCVFLLSPQDFEAHLTAPVRVDFILRNLVQLKEGLAELDIPLYVETVERRRRLPSRLIELCTNWGANHVFCNAEYEVDELRREAALTRSCLDKGISFTVVHDTCVVQPGSLKSGAGGALSIYSPWHRKWCAYINEHPQQLDGFPSPEKNPLGTRQAYADLFACPIPEAPKSKQLTLEEKTRFQAMWPAGEHEAWARLRKFISERILKYHEHRNLPGGNATSNLSAHLAAGTLAARTVVREAREAAPSKRLTDDRKQGHSMWIGEVAWRDARLHPPSNDTYTHADQPFQFYKHVLMNKPFKPEYSNIKWEYDMDQFKRWTDGKTGFPIVDAAMRQARHTGYMHNRCRMIVASFLAKDLLIDWRMGEKWFMEHLIDGDFASNNGGWGFSAGGGVDPQPYFRIFNPLLQSEKFDPEGDYIRKWIPELAGIKDKGIHDPYGRGHAKIAEQNGYPRPMVDHKEARERALARYKAGVGRNTA